MYSAIPKGPFIPGLEYSGIVESVGAGASQFKPGDRVMGICRFGAYSSHLNIDERYFSAYFRFEVVDKPGVLSNITNIFSK